MLADFFAWLEANPWCSESEMKLDADNYLANTHVGRLPRRLLRYMAARA